MGKKGHIPFRMCVVCREKRPKSQLHRFVFTKSGLLYDYYYNLPGRGVYICKKRSCREIFLKQRFQRKLKKMLVRG